jgi:hypothetical protein
MFEKEISSFYFHSLVTLKWTPHFTFVGAPLLLLLLKPARLMHEAPIHDMGTLNYPLSP